MINLNRFDLVSLRLFVAAIDAGSLTAGAEHFGISLAAASRRIAELEHHCGKALLQRSQRGVTATSEGQAGGVCTWCMSICAAVVAGKTSCPVNAI